ncbi:MAG: isochorismate synthase [Prevotella sp.]
MLTDEFLGSNFILYRLPRASKAHVIRCDRNSIGISYDFKEAGSKDGFVFAPFHITEKTPLLIFGTDNTEEFFWQDNGHFDSRDIDGCNFSVAEKHAYTTVFKDFHKAITDGKCTKIVLSRKTHITAEDTISPVGLFKTACQICPDMYVSLVSSPLCGTWLTATPEYLADSKDGKLHTAALAGTRPYGIADNNGNSNDISDKAAWNAKNIIEQDYVSQYIRERVGRYASGISENGPLTINAGNVCHLLTDYSYNLKDGVTLGMLLDNLHPTPAVCGIPKDYTYSHILQNEGYDREYYSGFQGPVSSAKGVHLFVTLRCMKVSDEGYDLYAGGGLVAESNVEYEWLETEAKMQTMKRCIATRKT